MMTACPGCNLQYSLDDRKIGPRGGRITCRQCGSRWHVAARVPDPIDPPGAGVTSPVPVARFDDSSVNLRTRVTCPSCGHHFAPAAGHAGPLAPAAGKPGVLVVEDQAYFVELAKETLGSEFDVTVTSSVAGARSLLEERGFDVVILDLSLEGGQDGTQILRATRSRNTPVLIFTAKDETELLGPAWEALRTAGASDVLIKGINVAEELQIKVRALAASAGRKS